MIKSLVKDVKPEVVLLELCDDRYDDWFNELAQHPNYDKYMTELQDLVDKKKIEKLMDYKRLQLDNSNFEYLIGMDYCSYRTMPCKTILGDRSLIIT